MSAAMKRLRGMFCWNGLWILLFLVGMGFFFIGMPKYYDDYWYMWHLYPWFETQGILYPENGGNIFSAGIPWQGIFDTWVEHYNEDNIRLPNMLVPVFLLFPKWIGSGLMVLLSGWTIVLVLKVSNIDWHKSPLVPPVIFYWMFMMPWRDYFGALDYQFNYILSSWVALILLTFLHPDGRCAGKSEWNLKCAGVFLLAFITGICHEGIGVPFAAGLAVMPIIYRRWRHPYVFVSIAGIAAGACLLMSVPGMHYRQTELITSQGLPWFFDNAEFDVSGFYLLLVLLTLGAVSIGIKGLMRSGLLVFWCVNCFVAVAICCYSGRLGRACFWLEVSSLGGILVLLRMLGRKYFKRYEVWSTITSGVLLAAVYIHIGFVGYYSLEFRKIQRDAIACHISNPKANLFADIRTLPQMPWVCGYLPAYWFNTSATFNMRGFYEFGEKYWRNCETVFPKEFRYIDGTDGEAMPGGSAVRELSGFYYAPLDSVYGGVIPENDNVELLIDFGKGYTGVGTLAHQFKSEKDGRRYVWLVPHLDWYVSHFKKIKAVKVGNYE